VSSSVGAAAEACQPRSRITIAITNFVVVERIFGDVNADACDVDFGFGNRGETILTALPPDARP
jgi:hypothetical protein